jgi:cellulose synthase operon protein B
VAYRLLDVEEARRADDLDLLLLSGAGTNVLLKEWDEDLPLRLEQENRSLRAAGLAWAGEAADPQVAVRARGSFGAIVSFESPLSGSRTVVALQSTDTAAAGALIDVLEDEGRVPLIRGDLALVRAGQVESFQAESVYYVGNLPWWRWLWFHISLHPVLLTIVVLAFAVLAALWVYGWLQRRVARRLQTNAS